VLGLFLAAPAQAQQPTITLAAGVVNPPPPRQTTNLTPPQTIVADTAAVVPVANVAAILQATLNAQGFTNANNWNLVTNQLTLPNNATFNITTYQTFLTNAGTTFGETMDFTLNPNLAGPMNPPAGSTVTEHWLQLLNESQAINGFGFPIQGQQGFWQVDNGDERGGTAAGAATGPYYDSNNMGIMFSTPPMFHDSPGGLTGLTGNGTYIHFTVFPTWDIFTPANGNTPAMETIDVGNFGLAWGFVILPEPSSFVLMFIGAAAIGVVRLRRGKTRQGAARESGTVESRS
jgi:hypothetical protein